ncbi:PH domain-containing protein [Nocardioides sp.]|uniref:PH domain-containing protein n=1 Tax=Nocardioides sp. TaxID=35761 RepID=UPI0027288BF1|nr:PH domain-containing protein [Nocardioides sp.]MDO9456754.1 PH domain-containing protein [Nocardioides sp.]
MSEPGSNAITGISLRDPAHRVSPRARVMWILGAAVEGIVALVVLLVAVLVWEVPAWTLALLLAVVVVWVAVVPQWRYLVHRWETSETAVYTQTGWWARERRIAPMSRIQTVDYAEGPVARVFGLASVTVTTASAAGALSIDGLDREVARRLVDDLTRQADAVEGDAT